MLGRLLEEPERQRELGGAHVSIERPWCAARSDVEIEERVVGAVHLQVEIGERVTGVDVLLVGRGAQQLLGEREALLCEVRAGKQAARALPCWPSSSSRLLELREPAPS